MAVLHGLHGLGGALQRGLAQLPGMREAGRLAGHRAQAEALARIEAGVLDPAVVEQDALRLAVFEIELAVVGAG